MARKAKLKKVGLRSTYQLIMAECVATLLGEWRTATNRELQLALEEALDIKIHTVFLRRTLKHRRFSVVTTGKTTYTVTLLW